MGRIVSASEEEAGREAKIREKIPMILFPFFSDFFFFTRLVTLALGLCWWIFDLLVLFRS